MRHVHFFPGHQPLEVFSQQWQIEGLDGFKVEIAMFIARGFVAVDKIIVELKRVR